MPTEAADRIYGVIRSIPPGCVASYGQIADLAGLAGRARLVGRLLRTAPGEAGLPWHRVLRSDGRIALPVGSEGFAEQTARLRSEGVAVRNGRVDMKRHAMSADTLLWGPAGGFSAE